MRLPNTTARRPGDAIPATDLGRRVALADKIDTLVGFFGISAVPTGSKDPFALRRAALGVIRIIIEGEIDLPLTLFLIKPPRHMALTPLLKT